MPKINSQTLESSFGPDAIVQVASVQYPFRINPQVNLNTDLTSVTITAEIQRRVVNNYLDQRGGISFNLQPADYLAPLTTATKTDASGNITIASTATLFIDQPIYFQPGTNGSVFGGLDPAQKYYIIAIGLTTIQVSLTRGGSAVSTTSASSSVPMTLVQAPAAPITIPTTRVNATKGIVAYTLDTSTWAISANDLSLDITATNPAIFTGYVNYHFPASGTTAAYDQTFNLLLLVTGNGVIN